MSTTSLQPQDLDAQDAITATGRRVLGIHRLPQGQITAEAAAGALLQVIVPSVGPAI